MTRFFAGICGVDKADMKFKNKIIISFCIIIFIPILLAVAVLFGFQKIQLKSIEQTYGVESDDYSYFSNSMQLLSRFTRESFETLLDLSKQDPDKLEDKAFLEQMNDTLREKYSYLVVRRGDELIYVGDDKEASLLTDLPAYGGEESGADTGIYVDGDKQALIKQIDFVYTDGSQGSVFFPEVKTEKSEGECWNAFSMMPSLVRTSGTHGKQEKHVFVQRTRRVLPASAVQFW